MYGAYYVKRFLQSRSLADHALSTRERAIHLRTCRYHHDLIGFARRFADDGGAE